MASIYLDNNASTPMLPAVWEAMLPFLSEFPGNPSSSHQAGRRARQALESARELIASNLGAHAAEVIFVSGATEANNLAIFGLAGSPPGHLLCSPIEHPCVLEPMQTLRGRGFDLDFLPVDSEGVVDIDELEKVLRPTTRLIALMAVNHETGMPQFLHETVVQTGGRAWLHCDAAAAAGKMAIDFHKLGVTTLAISAHKFHGPKGIGALLVRQGAKLMPQLFGGHQQQGRRPGTEPVALAVGMAKALDLALQERQQRLERVRALRDLFLETCRQQAAPVMVNGWEVVGLPYTLNISFPGCQADVLLMNLDLAGICCSTGSACSSGSLLPSPVLQAMNVPAERLHSAMRFSFSHLLTDAEVVEAGRRIREVVRRVRGASQPDEPEA